MMGKILPAISNPGDYVQALELLKMSGPPSAEEMARLLALYTKYLPDTYRDDPELVRLCLAVDLLFDGGEEYLAALELPEADRETLLLIRELSDPQMQLEAGQVQDIMDRVRGGGMNETLRIMLARRALDLMAGAWNFADMRDQIMELADRLLGCDTAVLDRGTALLQGVRFLCGL